MTNHNTVTYTLNKDHYVAGELVTGEVTLTILEPVQAVQLVAKFKGMERTRIRSETGTGTDKKVHYRHGRNTLLNDKVVLHQFDGAVVPVGTYTYSLQYHLPVELPGVFYFNRRGHYGVIRYTLKVFLDTPGVDTGIVHKISNMVTGKLDVETKRPLIISPVSHTQSQAISAEASKGFMFKSGKVHMKVNLDGDVYGTSDCIPVNVFVNNDSGKKIQHLKVKLMQEVKIATNRSFLKMTPKLIHEVQRQVFEGIEPHSEVEKQLFLQLDNSAYPSTQSALISCSYHLDVECDLKFALDLEVHPKVNIVYKPAPNSTFDLFEGYDGNMWKNVTYE